MTSEEIRALCVGMGAFIMATLLAIKGFLAVTKEVMDKLPAWADSLRAFIGWVKRGCRRLPRDSK